MSNDEGIRKVSELIGSVEKSQYRSSTRVGLDLLKEYIEDMGTKEESTKFETGAVRSADANHLDFMSMPWIGILGVARTAAEGGSKYGRFNYMQGMPVHDLMNHCFRHMIMYSLGDRSEPHREHAAWGILAAIGQDILDPELSKPHMLGPGATITPEVQKYLDDNKDQLAARRAAGEFADSGKWKITDLPEIARLLEQRKAAE